VYLSQRSASNVGGGDDNNDKNSCNGNGATVEIVDDSVEETGDVAAPAEQDSKSQPSTISQEDVSRSSGLSFLWFT
jgi:hypothetical protein